MEKRKVDGEGDFVVVLAGNAVILEEGFFLELGYGLDAVGVEEVVEEEGVVAGQVEVADFAHFVECWEDSFLQEIDAIVCEECLELHLDLGLRIGVFREEKGGFGIWGNWRERGASVF